jgi:hypothetical protein
MELVNQAALPEWVVILPRTAIEECLTASEKIESAFRHR